MNSDQRSTADWAWDNYKNTVLQLARGKQVLEIGAGRSPLFDLKELEDQKIDYVANDISKNELHHLPSGINSVVFDASGNIPESHFNRFDVIFSKMVQEHVSDGRQFYKNCYSLLKEGGIVISFHPTLYASLYLVNKLLPETVSRKLLQLVFPHRNENEVPKFPAKYELCRISNKTRSEIKRIGFLQVEQLPFWGHNYYDKLSITKYAQEKTQKFASNFRIEFLCTFAYTICKK